ncbi:GEM-like protein 4 [Pistacia vera]|uniref:GEM-like protein 4 n=1 Tax=Pistacia vera TaxID=55513 RepID=UPI001262CDC3|nr:GEM-like protein 4 [Pistacia vera]XP_031274854.1 GEM-like protein 4 [Pistacia vera]
MKKTLAEQVMGISIASTAYPFKSSPRRLLPEPASQDLVPSSANKRVLKLGKKANKFALGVREHVRLGPKITEIVKAKLSLGARILQVGGMNKVFKKLFSVGEGERLLKTCQCYLSTTAGPIAGLLFISTHKVAFCSERSIKFSSPNGELIRVHYKVVIPVNKIKIVNQSENVKKTSQKYIEIVTVDNFDFWFMGFLNYQKALKQLQQAISQAQIKC